MIESKLNHSAGKRVAFIFLGAAIFIFALFTFKETRRKVEPKPLQTPLPTTRPG